MQSCILYMMPSRLCEVNSHSIWSKASSTTLKVFEWVRVQKRVCGSMLWYVGYLHSKQHTHTHIYIYHKGRERRDTTQPWIESSLIYDSTVSIYKKITILTLLLHHVRFRLIYLSPNLWACSHYQYKVEGVTFYANKIPRKPRLQFWSKYVIACFRHLVEQARAILEVVLMSASCPNFG